MTDRSFLLFFPNYDSACANPLDEAYALKVFKVGGTGAKYRNGEAATSFVASGMGQGGLVAAVRGIDRVIESRE